ncbi:MAG: tripartite tricarboxylate transporter permease [Candidatus Thermoplasmatota archaeon]
MMLMPWLLVVFAFGILGFLVGVLTGMIPGFHVNNVVLIALACQGIMGGLCIALFGDGVLCILPLSLAAFLVALAITHTFITFIPAVFLGAPDESTALAVLPGHRMLLQGRGYEAVRLSAIGSMAGLLISFSILGIVRMVMGDPLNLYSGWVRSSAALLLIVIATILVMDERPRGVGKGTVLCGILVKGGSEGCTRISQIPGNAPARVRGRVLRTSGERELWVSDGTDEVHVRLRFGCAPPMGAEVTILGTMKREHTWRSWLRQRALALAVFLLAGGLGVLLLVPEGIAQLTFHILPVPHSDEGAVLLLPLFAGLFGLPMLILSLKGRARIPPQSTEVTPLNRREGLRSAASGTLAGCITGWLPGISSAAAAVLAKHLSPRVERETEGFVLSVSAVNTANAVFNLLALFVIGRARSGAMKGVGTVLGAQLQLWNDISAVPGALVLLLCVVLLAALLSFSATIWLGRRASKILPRVPYRLLALCAIATILMMVLIFSGTIGLLILPTATALGLLPPKIGVRRVHLMGCLIVPTVIFLL